MSLLTKIVFSKTRMAILPGLPSPVPVYAYYHGQSINNAPLHHRSILFNTVNDKFTLKATVTS